MNRSEEFKKIVEIFRSESKPGGEEQVDVEKDKEVISKPVSAFIVLCMDTNKALYDNEILVQKMDKLANQKEFSNDSTHAMTELSSLFETRLKLIQTHLQKLKLSLDNSKEGVQVQNHRQHIVTFLSKLVANHLAAFRKSLDMHASYVDERNRRVAKFSSGNHASVLLQGNDQTTDLKSAAGNIAIPVSKYAMFQPQNAAKISESSTRSPNPAEKHMAMLRQQKLQSNNVVPAMGATCPPRTSSAVEGLHRRHTGVTNASTTNTAVASPYATSSSAVAQEQQQLLKAKKDTRYKYAQQAEQSIRQMGQLFSQMATLVAEQSETITRIEDDVESGLTNTVEGHKSIQNVYDITKGNRAMIFKIFGLLIFFILLFLFWT